MAAQTNTTPMPDFREREARTLLHHLVQFMHIAADAETITVPHRRRAILHCHGGGRSGCSRCLQCSMPTAMRTSSKSANEGAACDDEGELGGL